METSREGVIIADTSGLVSLFLPNDHNHEVAVKAARHLQSEHKDILITAAVFVELLNILGRKVGHTAALAAVSELTPPFLVLTTVSPLRAKVIRAASCGRSISLPDALSIKD